MKKPGSTVNKTIYEPDNSLRNGYFTIFGQILSELHSARFLTYQLFKRDFLAMYRQSAIGFLWAVIIPIVGVLAFLLLNNSGVFSMGDIPVPYPLYAVMGISFWQIFSVGIIGGANSLVKAGAMIKKINFSKKTLVISSVCQSLVSFGVQVLLTIVLLFVYRYTPGWYIVLLPLLMLPLFLLTLGLGFILALFNGVVRDIGNLLSVLITFFMFLTPVFYSAPRSGLLGVLTRYNPLYYLISAPRDLILLSHTTLLKPYIGSSLISAALFVICIMLFHLTETRVTERI